MVICREETAHFCMLGILDHDLPTPAEAATIEALRENLRGQPISSEMVIEVGDPVHWTKEVGFFNDLVVLERTFGRGSADGSDLSPVVRELLTTLQRPILLTSVGPWKTFPERVLLVHDTRRKFDESIFIAAYLAERWRVELAVLPLSNGRNTNEHVGHIRNYLALHEVTAEILDPIRPNARAAAHIGSLSETGEYDLLVITGPDREQRGNRSNQQTELLWSILQQWPYPALIAT